MIRRFRHKGLERFYLDDDKRGINSQFPKRLGRLLLVLNRSRSPEYMNLPGFRLHALKGDLTGFWAVAVSGNWRLTFRFEGEDATDVDLVDYH